MYIIEEERLNALHNLMKWIAKNSEDWRKICGLQTHPLPVRECKRLLNKLRQEKFYEIVLVLMFIGTSRLTAQAKSTLLKMLKRDLDGDGIALLKKIS